MNSKKLLAFTLIELLVVIAIVGILSGFVLVSLNSATDSANDARRKSDLSQIVKALLVYNTSNPTYPIETCSIGSTCSATVNNALGQASGITGPNNTYYTYSSIDGTSFTVSAVMSDTDIYSYNPETGYSESSAEPRLPGYAKRQPITINSASALTDYQVKLTIAYDSDMQPDFDDLRFTSADGTTELNYWLESKTDSTTATVWVKIPSLSSGDNTIYMYYANSSATTASNGDNTFVFFDDFLGSTLDMDKWNTIATNGLSINLGLLTVSGTNNDLTIIYTDHLYGPDIIIRSKLSTRSYYTTYALGASDFSGIGSSIGWVYYTNYESAIYTGEKYATLWVPPRVSAAAYTDGDIITDPSSGYFTDEFAIPNGSKIKWRRNDGSWTTSTRYNGITFASPFVLSHYRYYGGILNVDWLLIRKYTATEPTSSFGTEQNN